MERQAPKAYRARSQKNEDGTYDVTSRPYEGSWEESEAELLRDHGYDPETHMIVGPWRESSWTAYKPKEYRANTGGEDDPEAYTFTAKAYKFKVAERPEGRRATDVEDLIAALDSRQPAMQRQGGPKVKGPSSFIFAIGDSQVGKAESPLGELSERYTRMVEDLALQLRHYEVEHLHIAWLGDCIEGVNSQGGKLRWRTTLTLTEQVRVLQRYMMYAIEVLAPHAKRLTVSSIPGNHDEANGRDLQTRMDDSWAVQALVSVEDAITFSRREDLKHVECYVPGPDQQGVTLEVGGMTVASVHGHQFRSTAKAFDWWKGQHFGGQDEGQADLLLHGHFHHWETEEQGKRLRVCVPAMEAESVWWKHRTGTPGNPGSLLLRIRRGRVDRIDRLY